MCHSCVRFHSPQMRHFLPFQHRARTDHPYRSVKLQSYCITAFIWNSLLISSFETVLLNYLNFLYIKHQQSKILRKDKKGEYSIILKSSCSLTCDSRLLQSTGDNSQRFSGERKSTFFGDLQSQSLTMGSLFSQSTQHMLTPQSLHKYQA